MLNKAASFLLVLLVGVGVVVGGEAPDATVLGPYEGHVRTLIYKYPTEIREEVRDDIPTDLWGKLYLPVLHNVSSLPIVVVLHGNHVTCGRYILSDENTTSFDVNNEYALTGTCPEGLHVIQSYLGYDYIGYNLASWGYAVVTPNVNRGVNGLGRQGEGALAGDGSLNLVRARVVLRHLQLLHEWSAGLADTPTPLTSVRGLFDLAHIGLVGHSRGGEAMRAVVGLYHQQNSPWQSLIPGANFDGVMDLASVDTQTRWTWDVPSVKYVALIAGCDGDVSTLDGIKPFDRMNSYRWEKPDQFKAVYIADGLNHNYLNTRWESPDAWACRGGVDKVWEKTDRQSDDCRHVALSAVGAFVRAAVGAVLAPEMERNFNPLYELPASVRNVTTVERSYTPSLGVRDVWEAESYIQRDGMSQQLIPIVLTPGVTSAYGRVVNAQGHFRHDEILRSNLVRWEQQGYYQDNWAEPGQGNVNASRYAVLSFRACRADADPLNAGTDSSDFHVALVNPSDEVVGTPVRISGTARLDDPTGSVALIPIASLLLGRNPALQSVPIPLSAFRTSPGQLDYVSGIRFIFDVQPTGAIWLANIRFHTTYDVPEL
eukprot:CAMPEP_0119121448 /NCGR_PEP_ID=MMETSP1310-20130426/2074_1 /TAXON_ID=464262 /ORGANISM="Genus nov. species nov., Strain RCC2339" /LENGTH=598 /DNA_ID=CAMNT_0007111015 /DNA_START=170 /DNA_END=1966 /DNA_ORIENTATION=-